MSAPHVLDRTVVELDAPDAEVARRLQEAVAERLQVRLEACLEACAARLADGVLLRLDRIAVDLGALPLAGFDDAFAAQLASRLGAVLEDALDRVERLPVPERERAMLLVSTGRIDVLLRYLATGTLPWHAARQADYDLDLEIDALLAEAEQALVAALAGRVDPRAAQRIALQVRPQTVSRLVAALAGARGAEALSGVRRDWRIVVDAQGMLTTPAARARVEAALDAAMMAAAAAGAGHDHAAGDAGDALAALLVGVQGATALAAMCRPAVPKLAPGSAVRSWIERTAAAGAAAHARQATVPPAGSGAAPAAAEPEPAAPRPSAARETELGADRSVRLHRPPAGGPQPGAIDAVGTTDGADPVVPRALASDPDAAPAHAAIEAGNAGLVLLWPLLPELLRRVGLLADRRFVGADAARRAVLLTQHLVDDGADWPEHILALNKLLCGVALDAPVPRRFSPTADEAREVGELFDTVRSHWAAVGTTSNAGLREAFLQRAGRVTPLEEAGWKLTVERKAYDLLLDRLPWGIGVVRLPWMRAPLYVEW